VITIITTIINIIAAVLIAARVLYFQRYIQKTVVSERNNRYTAVIVICIESSALIVLFSILYIVLVTIGSPASFIFMQSLVHINVRVHNLQEQAILYLFKILGHIAASDCLSGSSRKGCNVLTKTT
jgi:hypothetical protein